MFFCCYLLIVVFRLLGVAFLTLLERKILGFGNKRFGPNFVRWYGLLQPLADFLKLLRRFYFFLDFVDLFFWFLFPFWGLFLYLVVFYFLNMGGSFFFFFFGFMFFFCIYSLLVYMFVFGGWARRRKFRIIARVRVVVQMISYEVGYVFMFLVCLMFVFSYDYVYCVGYGIVNFWEFSVFFLFFWFVVCVAELSRSPFDFLEGESELVSGFNLEYGGGYFSLIFLVEYGFLLFISLISRGILFGWELWFFVFLFFFILIRGVFPRLRYDKIMFVFWRDVLVFFFFIFVYRGIFF